MSSVKNSQQLTGLVSVSLCIVSYNSKADITRCLDSLYKVLDRSKIDLQIFVSDNRSLDNSAAYLAKRYPEVQLIINDKNLGYGYGHNRVLELLNTKYHIILNPDITFNVDAIFTLIDYLGVNSDIAIVTPEIRNLDNTIQHLPKKYPKLRYVMSSTLPLFNRFRIPYTMSSNKIQSPIDIQVCTGSFMMIRTEIFKKINGFDEKFFMYFEDFDLSMRAARFGKIIYNPNTYVFHDWHRDSKRSKKLFAISIISMLRFYRKWWYRYG